MKGLLFLAPLAGISNYPFRFLCRRSGAAFCYTEMVSADAVIRNQEKTIRMVDIDPDEHPVGVQLFGSRPEYLAGAVKVIEALGADLIDLNMGCPVRKVIKKNGGAALLKDPILAAEIMAATVENTRLPVTVKLRLGWTRDHEVCFELGQAAQRLGLAAVTLHPRSRADTYADKADWTKIAQMKKMLSIPVIGNGDVKTASDAETMLARTGCDAVMIGRAAMRDPYVFHRIKTYLDSGRQVPEQTVEEKIELALEHTRMMVERFGQKGGTLMMRKHLAWYTRGLRGGAELRKDIMKITCYRDAVGILDSYRKKRGGAAGESG